jgi:hypothetical protein
VRSALSASLLLALAGACAPAAVEPPNPLPCDELWADTPPPESLDDLRALLAQARLRFYPQLYELVLRLDGDLMTAGSYFVAQPDLATLEDLPEDRLYTVRANLALLDDPPSAAATGAIFVHELKHILDYSLMDTEELTSFGLWYGIADDVSVYERLTDEYALALGCAEGLKAYRVWLYDHIPADDLENKQEDYFTPEEIDAWVAARE